MLWWNLIILTPFRNDIVIAIKHPAAPLRISVRPAIIKRGISKFRAAIIYFIINALYIYLYFELAILFCQTIEAFIMTI